MSGSIDDIKTQAVRQKKAQVLQRDNYEAEDVLQVKNSPLPQPDAPVKKTKKNVSVKTDDVINPIARKELSRRAQNKLTGVLEHNTHDMIIRDLGHEQILSEDVQMEKGWIRGQMEKLEKDALKRKKAQEHAEENAQKEREIQKQKQFDEAHNEQAHSARLSGYLDNAEVAVRSLLLGKQNKIAKLPGSSLLSTDYGKKFKERIDSKVREKKMKNKRSRLYQKSVMCDLVRSAASSYKATCYNAVNDLMEHKICDDEDYTDLSHFMIPGETAVNKALIDLYLGKDQSREGEGGYEGQDVQMALDKMLRLIFTTDLTGLNFENDAAMMKSAAVLERLSNQIGAFDRMAEKHDYLKTLDEDTRKRVNGKLFSLRSIANYYNVRKQIMTNHYYMTHYNDEMTMDIFFDNTDERAEIAELLLKANILGHTMLQVNGIDKKVFAKYKVPVFNDANKTGIYKDMKKELMSVKGQKDYLASLYRDKRVFEGGNLVKKSLQMTKETQALKEQFDRNKRVRRVDPARRYFFRTGVWKPDATKKEADEAVATSKKWRLFEYLGNREEEYYGLEWIDDEAFVKELTRQNDVINSNLKKIDTMEVRDLRDAFSSGYFDAHHTPDYDDEEALAADKRNYEIHGGDTCRRVTRLLNLRLKPVDDFVRNIYKKRLKGNLRSIDKNSVINDDGHVSLRLVNLVNNQEESDELDPIMKWANNLYTLENELHLSFMMDESIYQSKSIQAIILGEVSFDNKDYQVMKRRIKDNEEFLSEMIAEKFDYVGDSLFYDLRRFMGEKYLFADYKTVRDLAERYLRSIALLNDRAAKEERDFQYAYSSVMKKGVFTSKLKRGAVKLFHKRIKYVEKKGARPQDQEDGRVKRFKARMSMVRTYDGVLAEHTTDLKLTRWGWDKLMYYSEFILENAVAGEETPSNTETRKKLKQDIENYVTKAIESVKRLDEKNLKDEVAISRDKFLEVEKPENKVAPKSKIQKFTVIHKDDYSFAGLLRGKGLVNNPEIVKLIPDQEIREFLGKNISSVIMLNPEVRELFPFLKDITTLDQMDKLSVIEFKQVLKYFVGNLTENGLSSTVKKLLFDTDEKKETEEQKYIRKYTLLELLKHRTNPKDVSHIIKKIQNDYHSTEEVKLKRAQIALGRKTENTDGRIHYRFEDLPDQEKSFWKNNTWFVERLDHFDRAHNVWKKLEKLGPAAVEQVKVWIREIYAADEKQDKEKLFNELADMLQYDYVAAEKKKNEALAKGKKAPTEPTFRFKVNTALKSAFFNFQSDNKDLLKEIRDVFTKGQENVEAGKEKPIDVKKFIIEMSMFDTQGIVMSHGGNGQHILWADKGQKSDKAYKKALMLQAQDSIEKMDRLDKTLDKYIENGERRQVIREKLAPIVLQMSGTEYAKRAAKNENIAELREKIESCNNIISRYEEAEKEYNQVKEKVLNDKVSIKSIEGGEDKQSLARSLRPMAKAARAELAAAEESLAELLESTTTVSTDYVDEMLKNRKNFGVETFADIDRMLIGHVRANGEFSNELCDNVTLYESRKVLLSSYGNGELAPLWDEFVKNDAVFKDLIDPADTVAQARIKELYDFFAPLGAATFEQYSYVSEFFTADNIQKLLDKERPDTRKIIGELKGKSFDEQKKYWGAKLLEFQEEIYTKTRKGSGSVQENMRKAHGSLRDYLTKHFLYERPDFKEEVEKQNQVMKTGLFADAENLHKLADQHKQNLTQLAQHRADAILDSIETYVMTDGTLIEQAYDAETLKVLYRNIASHYVENVENAEKTFVKYVLKTEKGVDVSRLDDDALKNIVSGLPAADRTALKNRTDMFVAHIKGPAISDSTKDFGEKVEEWAKNFVEETNKALANDISFTEEYREGARARMEAQKKASQEVRLIKNAGKSAYDKILFGGKLSDLKIFGDIKQAIVYGDGQSRRGNIVSQGSDEDRKLFNKAKEYFKKEKDTDPEYPDILADCLDEYTRMQNSTYNKVDQFLSWMLREDSDVKAEAKRLKQIYDYGREKGEIPDEAMELYLTYAARFADKKDLTDLGLKDICREFISYYEQIRRLEADPPAHPVLRAAHEDMVEKMKAHIFVEKDKSPAALRAYSDLIDNQLAFFEQAKVSFPIIEDIVATDEYTGKLDKVYQTRYVNGLYEYFVGRILEDGLKAARGEARFDRKDFEKKVRERIIDNAAREALLNEKGSVSGFDFQSKNVVPGSVSKEDFERHLVENMHRDDLTDYNKLNDEQKKLFALSLYVVNKEERGTFRAIYGKTPGAIKVQRDLILKYMKGEDVTFTVDYAKAMRALTARGENYKLVADEKLFDQALTFVKQVEQQKKELMPRDFARLSDSEASAKAADMYRRDLGKKNANFKTQMSEIDNLEIIDKDKFLNVLQDFSLSDQERKGDTSKTIKNVMNRVANLTVSQQSLLIYVLQDRTVLDYSTRGKNNFNIVPYANEKSRFELYEKMLTEKGRLDVMEKIGDPMVLEKSMKSLLSFQLRDDKELKTKLTKDDFAKGALERRYAIDWALLDRAVDFIHEIENERIRLVAVRQAGELVRNGNPQGGDPAIAFYDVHRNDFTNKSEVSQDVRFDNIVGEAYKTDKDLIKGTTLDDGQTMDDLMSGYKALTPAEKRLFFRALEHREILDVSQKNLYRNVFGLAERDYVDPKGRDALIDEFMNKGDDVDTNMYTYDRALVSLCSTQINDDMDFMKMNGLNMTDENFTVTNQWFVTDRGTWLGRTVFDWKLFQRALQFVTRTTNEKRLANGNKELYRALGDVEKNGEMNIDTSFMRVNLHHTGARFFRFLAKEGYGKAINYGSTVVGLFDSAAAYTDYVISAKTSNYIYGKFNQAVNKDVLEKQEAQEKEPEDLNKVLKKTQEQLDEANDKVQTGKSKIVQLEMDISNINIQKGLAEKDPERAKGIEALLEKTKQDLEDAKNDLKELEHDQSQLRRKRDRTKRAIEREDIKESNSLGKIQDLVTSIKEQEQMIKDSAKKVKEGYDTVKEMFGFEKTEEPEEVLDDLDKKTRDVKVSDRTKSITGNPKLDKVLSYAKMTPALKKMLDKQLIDNQANLEAVDKYVNMVFGGVIGAQAVGEFYDNVELWVEKRMLDVSDIALPNDLKKVIDESLDNVLKSQEFITNMSAFVSDGVEILGHFRDIVGASKNIIKLNKSNAEAKDAKAEDDQAIEGVSNIKFNVQMIKDAADNNLAFVTGGKSITKSIEGRKIMGSVGELAKKAISYADVEGIDEIIDTAIHLADFFWKCMADNKSIKDYYGKAGNSTLRKLDNGQYKMKQSDFGAWMNKKSELKTDGDGNYVVNGRAFDMLRTAQGFERNEELSDFLKLNMVYSLMFSSSKFNPMKASRILAECTMTVLGFEELIGKTDQESALKIYEGLKK